MVIISEKRKKSEMGVSTDLVCCHWTLGIKFNKSLSLYHIQVHLSGKLHPCDDVTSKTYKPAFHGSHLSCNTFYGSATTLQCCGNHLSQRQMITQTVNLLVGYQVGNSQENLTRSLCLIRALYILNTSGPCYNLMSASFPTQGYHVVYICPDIIF